MDPRINHLPVNFRLLVRQQNAPLLNVVSGKHEERTVVDVWQLTECCHPGTSDMWYLVARLWSQWWMRYYIWHS